MESFFHSKMGLALYVGAIIGSLKVDSALTMTITREKSGDYSVATATSGSLDDTDQDLAVLSFLPTQVNT